MVQEKLHVHSRETPYRDHNITIYSQGSELGMSPLCYCFLPICFQASLKKYTNFAKENTPLCYTFLIKIVV